MRQFLYLLEHILTRFNGVLTRLLTRGGFLQFIVMFRARFSDALPKSLPHYGPQDIERGVQDTVPGEHIERLLCALIGLVLNRKKEVEYVSLGAETKFLSQCEADWELGISRKGHYQRALEEAVQTHSSQWPRAWGGKNPLHGGGSFASMTPEERVSTFHNLCEIITSNVFSCDF